MAPVATEPVEVDVAEVDVAAVDVAEVVPDDVAGCVLEALMAPAMFTLCVALLPMLMTPA